MYCSSQYDKSDCGINGTIRNGYQNKYYGLEDLFYNSGVDVQIYGHEHNYERMYPVYKFQWERVENASLYSDVTYPVHLISGSAGCREMHSPFLYPEPGYSFFRTKDYGFSVIQVQHKLSLLIKQYSVEKAQYIDSFEVRKSQIYPVYYKH